MHDLSQTLTDHRNRYPLMQPCDFVKIIYQSTFGGAHLLSRYVAKSSIIDEWEQVGSIRPPIAEHLFESIGYDAYRVYLRPAAGLPDGLARLADCFTASCALFHGTDDLLRNRLIESEQWIRNTSFPFGFSADEYCEYTAGFLKAPAPVSHSSVYTDAYAPSYRVIHKQAAERFFCDEFRPSL